MRKREKKDEWGIIIRTMPFSFSFFLIIFDNINKKAAVFNWLMPGTSMQCPLLVPECRQITRRKATESSTTLRPGVQSDRAAASSRRARAQRVHQRRLPWHPHAYRAALRVSPASKFSERYLSFPPIFTTFGHFLKPTTTWNVLTKPSSTLLWEKNLAPSKVGTESKKKRLFGLA